MIPLPWKDPFTSQPLFSIDLEDQPLKTDLSDQPHVRGVQWLLCEDPHTSRLPDQEDYSAFPNNRPRYLKTVIYSFIEISLKEPAR